MILNFYFYDFLVPVSFYGAGEYNLKTVKKIEVTDAFLGLSQETRECQNQRTISNCTTETYLNDLLDMCNCLPYNLWINDFQEKVLNVYNSILEF